MAPDRASHLFADSQASEEKIFEQFEGEGQGQVMRFSLRICFFSEPFLLDRGILIVRVIVPKREVAPFEQYTGVNFYEHWSSGVLTFLNILIFDVCGSWLGLPINLSVLAVTTMFAMCLKSQQEIDCRQAVLGHSYC